MASPTERLPSTAHEVHTSQNNAVSTPTALDELLSYPATTEHILPLASTSSSSSSAQPRTLLKDRLYVGNLHPTVDEYTLLQLFSKFGKISKLDFLFHKAGPLKGKPRGYAFVEYASKVDAEKALVHAHDRLLRGRKLVVTYANQAPLDAAGAQGLGAKSRRPMSDVGKPTTLSLLKSAGTGRSDATDAKIARMEAKLRQLESTAGGPGGAGTSLPGHPSLPAKPVAAIAAAAATNPPPLRHAPTSTAPQRPASRSKGRASALPILPIKPLPQSAHNPPAKTFGGASTSTPSPPNRAPSSRKSALTGVRMMKRKHNDV
ncbi:RNA-binding domain-containing protein [Trametes elegans]|nr:RNA-binding domain-containing protein [Trametes elegans]